MLSSIYFSPGLSAFRDLACNLQKTLWLDIFQDYQQMKLASWLIIIVIICISISSDKRVSTTNVIIRSKAL
jgi:hypothetical protein